MNTLTITRDQTADDGTHGKLVHPDGSSWVTGELPWRNALSNKSCAATGSYLCKYEWSPKHGMFLYRLQNVIFLDPNGHKFATDNVEIHAGNYSGDVDLGYKSDVLGCCLLGTELGLLTPAGYSKPQQSVLNSKMALLNFHEKMNGEDFTLNIVWAEGLPSAAA